MPESNVDRLYTQVESLRRSVEEMRAEQRAMAQAIEQMTATFRSLAIHLGISTEPYRKEGGGASRRELPGFA